MKTGSGAKHMSRKLKFNYERILFSTVHVHPRNEWHSLELYPHYSRINIAKAHNGIILDVGYNSVKHDEALQKLFHLKLLVLT